MGFIYPQFLFAFALLAIPVVIHLFNFRRYKKILFADISFLKEIKTQTKQRSRLRHIIILLLRLFAFSALILAFAQPFWKTGTAEIKTNQKIISIYIDNSFSMQAVSENGPLLEIAKQRSIDLVKQYGRNDLFQIVTNNFEGIEQRLYPREEIVALIDEIKLSPVSRNLQEVFQRIQEVQKEYSIAARRILLFSDFQSSLSKVEQIKNIDKVKLILIPLQKQNKSNISIDSVWFATPVHSLNGSEELTFRIRNYSNENIDNANVEVLINGAAKAKASFSVPAQTYIDSSVKYTNSTFGIQRGSVKIEDENLTFDNNCHFSYNVKKHVSILCLNSKKTTSDTINYDVKSVFQKDPFYHFTSVYNELIDFSVLGNYDFIVLNKLPEISSGLIQEIEKYVSSGGNILLLPSIKTNTESFNNFNLQFGIGTIAAIDTTKKKVAKINMEDVFFKNVFEKKPTRIDLPFSKFYFNYASRSNSLETVLFELENGKSMFSRFPYKKGKLYISFSATETQAGNFSRHALFVLTLLRSAELSQETWPSYFTLGRDISFEIRNKAYSGENVFTFKQEKTDNTIIPATQFDGNAVRVFIPNQINEAGSYNLLASNQNVFTAAINYDRRESNPEIINPTDLEIKFKVLGFKDVTLYARGTDDAKVNLASLDDQSKIWKWLIWLTILFIFTESLLIRIWKT